jgi:hypothetical protein
MNEAALNVTEPELRVRPYALTGGRTRSQIHLEIESIAKSTAAGLGALSRLTLEPKSIVMLCSIPQSIAEISAHLRLPLGVVRVLVGDMVSEGLIAIQQQSGDRAVSNRPDLKLLERVLDGLQSL